MQLCPHCGKENAAADMYCYSCGHILPNALSQTPGTNKLEDVYETLAPHRRWGTAYFGRQSKLALLFRDTEESLMVDVERETVLGRFHEELDVAQPDIDLTAYGAMEKGVSRTHIKFVREMDTLTVVDLNSSNNTFLNGQRLMPFEARILRDADELRLGHMVIRVMFAG